MEKESEQKVEYLYLRKYEKLIADAPLSLRSCAKSLGK